MLRDLVKKAQENDKEAMLKLVKQFEIGRASCRERV